MPGKTNEQKYQKKTPREHVLLRPDTYVGDIDPTEEEMWVYNDDKLIKKNIKYVPAFYKIFDEVLVNSRDHSINDPTCSDIKVEINQEENMISIFNNGDNGIPVEIHKEHGIYIPSMIFGEMLTGSNFDDTEKRTTGGRNGYGAKLANIFSKKFIVEVFDAKSKMKFKQVFEENMSVKNEPEVEKVKSKEKSYVKITFYPDLERFKMKKITDETIMLYQKRVCDIAATTTNKVKVYFNEEHMDIPNFNQYVNMFYDESIERIYEEDDRWAVCALYTPNEGGECVSYVNSICTYRGGTHVSYIVDNIIKRLIEHIKKKDKTIKVTPSLIKENLVFFVNTIIENPAFISQTKDALTTKSAKFGSKYEVSEKFMKNLLKTNLVNQVMDFARFKETASLKKTDGKKVQALRGVPKLEDANKAGSKHSNKCSLILTEGDSAKAFAMAGLSIVGRSLYGVFPLKGKLLNVREASPKQLLENEEIKNLKQIIGLQHNKDYSSKDNFDKLRYGRIIILTDQDVDGSHIKGLLFNFFHYFWPSLMKKKGYLTSLSTPIVKAFKGNKTETFYNLTDYDNWRDNNKSGWKTKYYKGLGTSTSKEAKEYFVDIEDKLINYFWADFEKEVGEIIDDSDDDDSIDSTNDEEELVNSEESIKSSKSSNSKKNVINIDYNDFCTNAITLAFDKRRSDDRKEWLLNYDKNEIITYQEKNVAFKDFINKDLIHFSNDDTSRSIPNLMDGFKPSQRKIMHGSILRKLYKDEVKVAQLSGFVSDKSAYHHGEASLMGAIIGMAQDYVGSNNINILDPDGQFGTRLKGGKDAASSRYIWTRLNALTQKIFRQEDEAILKYMDDDGISIEPEWYCPIIPMILVNGSEGIGTGFSTKIPCYNPLDIVDNIKRLMNDKDTKHMIPWYQNYQGTIAHNGKSGYEVKGVYHVEDENTLVISELPIGEWTSNYKEFLDGLIINEEKTKNGKKKTTGFIEKFTDDNTDKVVKFTLHFPENKLGKYIKADTLEKKLKLNKKINITNMHLFNANGTIKKYSNGQEIIKDFYDKRLECYELRKAYIMRRLQNELLHLKYKVKFIEFKFSGKIIIDNKTRQSIIDKLVELEFPELSKDVDDIKGKSYSYITTMSLFALTKEKIDELNEEYDSKKAELESLESKTIKEIWEKELDEFLHEYKRWYKSKHDEYLEEISNTHKISTKKSKKSKGSKKKKPSKKKSKSKNLIV